LLEIIPPAAHQSHRQAVALRELLQRFPPLQSLQGNLSLEFCRVLGLALH
jgi:hypothetical protein